MGDTTSLTLFLLQAGKIPPKNKSRMQIIRLLRLKAALMIPVEFPKVGSFRLNATPWGL